MLQLFCRKKFQAILSLATTYRPGNSLNMNCWRDYFQSFGAGREIIGQVLCVRNLQAKWPDSGGISNASLFSVAPCMNLITHTKTKQSPASHTDFISIYFFLTTKFGKIQFFPPKIRQNTDFFSGMSKVLSDTVRIQTDFCYKILIFVTIYLYRFCVRS